MWLLAAASAEGDLSQGLIAHWPFDTPSSTVHDATGHGHAGTNFGATWSPAGVKGGCFSFDGLDDYISVPHHEAFSSSNATVSLWLKTPTSDAPSGMNRVLGKWLNRFSGWYVHLIPDNGIYVAVANGSGSSEYSIDAPRIGRTAWTHIAVCMTPLSLIVYTNGLACAETNWPTATIITNDEQVTIGGFNSWGWGYLQGQVDEVKIWDRVLTPEEVALDAYSGADPLPVPTVWPTHLDFSTNHSTRFAYCGNAGAGSYGFTTAVSQGGSWLSVWPPGGTVAMDNVGVLLLANRSSLVPGTYEGFVTITPSTGGKIVITATVEATAGNLACAEANGPYVVDQGTPAAFTAVGSFGQGLQYRWEVGAGFATPYDSSNAAFTYTDTYDAGVCDVTLTVRDSNSPPHTASDSTLLTVYNVAPTVELGGPYSGRAGTNTFLAALVSDPGIHDTHECRWNFDGDAVWDTPWSNLFVIAHTYAAAGSYVAACEVRDQHGAAGSDTATVLIDPANAPPAARAVLAGSGAASTNLPGLGCTVTLDGSASSDPDMKPNPVLYFDWREDVANPQKPAIPAGRLHDPVVTTDPLNKPGTYRFHLAVFDGEYLSALATLVVRVPGWHGQVICEGFAGRVPLWGVEVTVTNTFTGNAHMGRTDRSGAFLVDAGAGPQVAELKRRFDRQNVTIDIDPGGRYSKNVYLLPTCYIYAGQIVTGTPAAYVGLPYAQTELLIGNGMPVQADAIGAFGYGMVPESWPLDGDEYLVRVQKAGWRSVVRAMRLNMNMNSEVIAVQPSAGNAEVHGTVRGQLSGLPVADVTVDFGNGWSAVTAGDGTFGPLAVPDGEYLVVLARDGFTRTMVGDINLLSGTTNLDLVIHGGEVSVYGQIYDINGIPVTNASVMVDSVQASVRGAWAAGRMPVPGTAASGAGYYDVMVAKGTRSYVVSSPDFEPVTVTVDVNDHTKRDIILPIPEPAGWLGGLALGLPGLRRLRRCRR
ncbi:PKD domain-containing protein [bacterium]|nr:PKD domain-containing protein [bacterium]